MDPSLVPSFRPVAAAIEWISPISYVNVTVPDRMNFFGVHDMAVQLVAVWKNRFEWIQQPDFKFKYVNNMYKLHCVHNVHNSYNALPVREGTQNVDVR